MKQNAPFYKISFFILLIFPLLCSAQNAAELVDDLQPGTLSAQPENLTSFKNKVYFFAKTGPQGLGKSLFASDGTPGNTEEIIALDSLISPSNSPVVVGDFLFFFTINQDYTSSTVWKSDGTAAGTMPVLTKEGTLGLPVLFKEKLWFANSKQISYFDENQDSIIVVHTMPSFIENFTVTSNYLYWFGRYQPGIHQTNYALYRSNEQDGLQSLADISQITSSTSGGGSLNKEMHYDNGKLHWYSFENLYDAMGNHYANIKAAADGFSASIPAGVMYIQATTVTDSTFFLCTGVPPSQYNRQLFATTPEGEFQNVLPSTISITESTSQASPNLFFATSKRIFFRGSEPMAYRTLFTSDGTLAGTHLVKNINTLSSDSHINNFIACGDYVLFSAFDGNEFGVWYSDGTESGTQKIASLPDGVATSFLVVGETLFMSINTDSLGKELWKVSSLPCSVLSKSVEPGPASRFSLFPNPVSANNAYISLQETSTLPFRLRLSDLMGKVIWQQEFKENIKDIELPTKGLSAGLYFVTMEENGRQTSRKLVISR